MNRPVAAFTQTFRPDLFFIGRTAGSGEVRSRTGRLLKRCRILTQGVPDEAFGAMHFDETYLYDDGEIDTLHWAIARDGAGELSVSEITVVGHPKMRLEGPTWRIRFKRMGQAQVGGLALTYDAVFTAIEPDVVVKRAAVKLFGVTVAELTAFHRRIDAG